MKTFRLLFAFAFAGICLSMASCIDSKNPISDPEKAKVDQKFLGVWRMADKGGDVIYYHVGLAGGKLPRGVLRAISIRHNKDGSVGGPDELLLFCTEAGNSRFLNVACVDRKEDLEKLDQSGWNAKLVNAYFIIKYELKDDSLKLWQMDRNAKAKAIEAGKIKGEITKNDVTFTDTSENLAKFLADPANAGLFDAKDSIRYDRVK